jgi:hypothetical protein
MTTLSPSIAGNDVLFSCPACKTKMCVSPQNAGVTGPCIECGTPVSAHEALVAAAQAKLFEETGASEPTADAHESSRVSVVATRDLSTYGNNAYGRVFAEQSPVAEALVGDAQHPSWTGAWSTEQSPAAETFEDSWEQKLNPDAPDPDWRSDPQGYGAPVEESAPPLQSNAMERAQAALFGITSEEEPPVSAAPVEAVPPQAVDAFQPSFEPEPATAEFQDPVLEARRQASPFLPSQNPTPKSQVPFRLKAQTPSPGEYDAIDQDFIGKVPNDDSHLPLPRDHGPPPHATDSSPSGFVPNPCHWAEPSAARRLLEARAPAS